jgi:hypothetical protein
MEPSNKERQTPQVAPGRRQEPKSKLQVVKLEERIAPKLSANHSESMVRELAKTKLQIVKLEERIAPKLSANHSETLVRASR